MTIQEAIAAVVGGAHLGREATRAVFDDIMSGKTTDAQIAALIVALRMKGETVDEITGAAEVMREKVTRVIPDSSEHLVDTCGTGGDRSHTFNISTAAALVAAGAGAVVAKHGNRSVSSKSGSADVLEALGVAIAVTPETMKRCLDTIGICFLFAPALHAAMKYAIGPRREIGLRTIFNVLGPLTNPALAPAQVLGVFAENLVEPLARTLANLGVRKSYVVHGADHIDEIALSGETLVAELTNGVVTVYRITPEQFGLRRAPLDAITGNTAADNAAIIRDILNGAQGPCRDVVVFNAAFACAAAGIAPSPAEGIAIAAHAIDSGAARAKLDALIRETGGAANG